MKTFCSYFNQDICRSCDLITLDYEQQILKKEKTLGHSGLLPTVPSNPLHFRNKAKFVVTGTVDNPIIGLSGIENLDHGRELLDCPLHVNKINELLPSLKKFITLAGLTPYQIEAKKGELKGIIIFHSTLSNQTYLRFILRSKEAYDRIKKNHLTLLESHPDLQCISINIQPIPHAILEGDEEIFITDKKSINHQLGNISFSLGPRAFVQTNQEVSTKLYETAASWVKDSGYKRFMELFCGQGAFSFFCAPYIDSGLGIEINPDAIVEAKKTAHKYELNNLDFKSADASLVGTEIENYGPDIILVNPPRRGLGKSCELILKNSPKMIIYSSCNYETLNSDLEKLKTQYEIKKIQIFDMFPHTSHFETLVELRAIKLS